MVKMVFSDIDGTLINSEFIVTPRTKTIIKKLVDKGLIFVPVSARMPEAISPIIESIGINSPIISYNGALIQDSKGHEISSSPLSSSLAQDICYFIQKDYPEVAWNVYSHHQWFSCDRSNEWVIREEKIVAVDSTELSIHSIKELSAVHKLLLMGDPSIMDKLEKTLKTRYANLSIAKSAPYFIEIMEQGIRKGQAIKTLADVYDVTISDTIAFGDNFNDLDMLKTAGKGYVMANGPREVREQIGRVTDDNNHDGIAIVLESYLGEISC